MRILIFDHFQIAYQSLRANRARSLLTMLGITIGIASITAILSLAGGASELIDSQIDDLGGNVAVIRPAGSGSALFQTAINPTTPVAASTLTEKDLTELGEASEILDVAPLMLISGVISSSGESVDNAHVVATTPSLIDISDISIRDGQFMDSVTNRQAAVIGPQLAVELYGTDQAVGNTFTIRGETYTVIGILKRQGNPVNFNGIDFDRSALINLESAKDFYANIAHIQQINLLSESKESLPAAIQQAEEILIGNHQGEKDFTISSGEQISQPANEAMSVLSSVAAAIAGISLVVGGIGVMNIMLVSVSERTREIGIRKALGASNSHIIWQFLIEALALSFGGGILGYFTGYLLSFATSTVLPFTPTLSLQILGIAVAISVTVGVVFGLYPAIRAARKDPIESLRHFS